MSKKTKDNEPQLDEMMGQIMAQSGQDEEEVTDAQAAAVLAEIFAGKEASDEPSGPRKVLLSSTTKKLEQATKAGKIAVAYDTKGDQVIQALESYEKAIELFGEGLGDEALSEQNALQIVATLESYLNRSIELQLLYPTHDFHANSQLTCLRQPVLQNMVKYNFNALKHGVGLYSRAKKLISSSENKDDWIYKTLFTEALECLLVVLKGSSESAKSPTVSKCVNEMITKLEDIKVTNA